MSVRRCICALSLAIYMAAMLLLLVGLATPEWQQPPMYSWEDRETMGLWQRCAHGGQNCRRLDIFHMPPLYYVVVGFVLLGLLFSLIAGFTYVILPVSGGFQMLAAACLLVAVSVYGAILGHMDQLGYSYGLVIGATFLFLINGIITVCLFSKGGSGCKPELPCMEDFLSHDC